MGFSRQEYWSRVPFPSPGDLPDPGIELKSPALQTDSLPSEPPWKPLEKGNVCVCVCYIPEMNTTLQINYISIKYTYIYGSGGLVTKLCPTLQPQGL